MARFSRHVFAGAKWFRLERIVRPQSSQSGLPPDLGLEERSFLAEG